MVGVGVGIGMVVACEVGEVAEVGECDVGSRVLLLSYKGGIIGDGDLVGEVVCSDVGEEEIVIACDVLMSFSLLCSSPPPSTTSTRTLMPSMGTPE